jgi:hypothetical protein
MAMAGVLAVVCSSISAGAGAYFYMGKDGESDTSKEDENAFRQKYQDAVRDLEYEKQASSQVEEAKTELELAQEKLEIARLDFESREYASEAEKNEARARLFSAEQDVETANNRLSEAETLSERAAIKRADAEADADAALRIAIVDATTIETRAVAEADARVKEAQGKLDAAIIENQRIINDAEAYAKAKGITSKAEQDELVKNAEARLKAAQLEAETAKQNREKAEQELQEKEAKEAARLLKEAEEKAKREEAAREAARQAEENRKKQQEEARLKRRIADAENGGLDDEFAQCYLDNNPDLQAHYGATNIGGAKDHWYHHGIHEYRSGARQNNYMCDGSGTKTVSSLEIGQAAICGANAIGPAGAVFRYVGNNELRWYPNPDIAGSWDPGWENAKTIDCKGATQGANMEHSGAGSCRRKSGGGGQCKNIKCNKRTSVASCNASKCCKWS